MVIASRCAQTISNQRIYLARMAQSRGWDVTLAGQSNDPGAVQSLNAEGFNFHDIPVDQASLRVLSLVRLTWQTYRLCRNVRPVVFHAFTIKPTIAGLFAAFVARVPVRVATVAGLGHAFLSPSLLVRMVAIWLLRLSMLTAHRIYFYNEADREFFVKQKIVSKRKSTLVAGSGIDTSNYQPSKITRDGNFTLVFVGRMLNEKGVPELIEAMEIVHAENANVQLLLIGDIDPHNPSSLTKDQLQSIDKVGYISWVGHVQDVRPFMQRGHVIVLPSHREGIPLALLEGAAMGRALLATEVPGCADVVLHGKTGLLVPPHEPQQLADAILELAGDYDRLDLFGENARADAERRFDTKVINGAIVDEYMVMAGPKLRA
jgi:glycosyltransferase involved in cell wall biosynthesis